MIKWGGQLPIETPRLTLVPMQEEDGADLFAYYTEEIAHYQYPKPYGSPEEAVREILQFAEGDSVGSVLFTLRDRKNQFLGVADIHGLSDREPEVGVWIRKEFWRQGYPREAVGAMLGYYGQKGYASFRWEADRRNPASIHLAESLGGVLKGTDEYENMRGMLLQLNVYSIPAPEV